MKKHRSDEEKQALIDLFRSSGKSKTTFCIANEVSVTTLNSWIRKEKNVTKTVTFLKVPKSAPLEATTPIVSQISLEINSVKISFSNDITSEFLGGVLKVIAHV